MKTQRDGFINLAMFLATILLAAYCLTAIPVDQEIAVHWSFSGTADNFMPAYIAVLVPPLLCVAFFALQFLLKHFLGAAEVEASGKLYRVAMSLGFGLALIVQATIVGLALGYDIDPVRVAVIFIGLVLMLVGNNLPRSRRNKIAGIRIRSTLESEENWAQTHHFAGKLYLGMGLVAILIGVVGIFAPLNIVLVIVCAIIPEIGAIIYSRNLIKRNAV